MNDEHGTNEEQVISATKAPAGLATIALRPAVALLVEGPA